MDLANQRRQGAPNSSSAQTAQRPIAVAFVGLLMVALLAAIVPTATAAVTNNGLCDLKYQGTTSTPSVGSGSAVPAGTLVTFGVGTNAVVSGDILVLVFPPGTSFDSSLVPGDFSIRQTATNSGVAPCTVNAGTSGSPLSPVAGSIVDPSLSTVKLVVQAGSLSSGANAGKGLVTVSLSRSDAIRFPLCPATSRMMTVTHTNAAGTIRGGAVDNVFTFTAGLGCMQFVEQPQNTGRGLPFVPVVRVKVTDAAANPVAGAQVTLSVTGRPANVWLANGPGQDIQPAVTAVTPPRSPMADPVAVTNALGIASFPGLTIVADIPTFTGAAYQLHATGSAGWVDSDPFLLGKTSPPWPQQGFSAQRTGWSPNIADFTDPADRFVAATYTITDTSRNAFGSVTTTPILVDLTSPLDGVLDMVAANGVDKGTVGLYGSAALAFDMASCATGCDTTSAARIWSGGLASTTGNHNSGHGVPDGNIVTNVVAAYGPGRAYPTIYLQQVIGQDTSNGANPYWISHCWVPFPTTAGCNASGTQINGMLVPVVANMGPGAAPYIITGTGARVAMNGVKADGTNLNGIAYLYPAGTVSTPFGGALATAELRSTNSMPEIVAATAQQGWVASSTTFGTPNAGSLGLNSTKLLLCTPSTTSVNCSESTSIADVAVAGISIADLDGDGRFDVVANGVRSGTERNLYPSTGGELNVFRGTTVPIGSPLRYAEGSDLMNTAALGSLHASNQDGAASIVNINHGAPPAGDDRAGDTYSDIGNVYARGLDATATNIVDKGVWNRGGTNDDPRESPGGGILLVLDPRPAHGYRPDFVFGSKDGTVTAARVTDASATNPPSFLWSIGSLGSQSAGDATSGIPISPLAAGDVTGDCHAEIFAGLSGGQSHIGEVAVLQGKDAVSPGAPSFTSPLDYDIIPPSSAWTGAAAPDQNTAPGHGFKARFAWNAPATDGGLPIVAYKVFRGTTAGFTPAAGNLVGIWPSGTAPTFSAGTAPAYRPFTDLVPSEGDYYYKVAAVTCFTLAQDPLGVGTVSAPFYVEVKFGKADNLRAIPSGDPAYPAPVQVNLAWDRLDNFDRPHGCEWVDSYNLYKLQTDSAPTNVVAPGNKVTSAPWPVAGGPTAPASYTYTDTSVARAAATGPGGLYYYVVNPVNCVGEQNVFPNPPYTNPPTHQVFANVRVPAAPTLDSAAAQYTPLGLRLQWTASSVVNGCNADALGAGGRIEGYQIYRGTSPGSQTLYDTVLPSGPNGLPRPVPWTTPNPTSNPNPGSVPVTYFDANVVPNTVYYYKVTTVNCVGESLRSNERSASLPTMPATPTGVIANPFGDPAFPGLPGQKQVRIAWNGAASWGSCASGNAYEVYRGSPGGPYTLLPGMPVVATSHTDATVAVGQTYAYVVRSVCTTPDPYVSAMSTEAQAAVTVPLAPGSSPGLTIVAGPGIRVDWTTAAQAPNNANCPWLEGFHVYRSVNGGPYAFLARSATLPLWPRSLPAGTASHSAPAPVPATWLVDTPVAVGSTYSYRVTAINCVGESAPSSPATVTPTAPLAPTGLLAKPHGDPAYAGTGPSKRVQLDWNPVTTLGNCLSLSGYNVYRNGDPTPAAFVTAPATTFLDTVGVGSTYTYEVAATCTNPAAFESVRSAVVSADVRVPNAVAAPTLALVSGPAVQLVWTDPGAVSANCNWQEGYRVYRSVNGGAYALVATLSPVAWPRAVPSGPMTAPTPAPALTYLDPIAANGLHSYKVSAINCVGEGAEGPAATIGGPFDVTLTPASTVATPLDTTWLAAQVRGGVPAYSCTWSVTPAGGNFVAPGTSCTSAATFGGGEPGVCYTVRVQAEDSADVFNPGISTDFAEAQVCVVDNEPPVAAFANPSGAQPGEGVAFTDLSHDSDGFIVDWYWDFGDGTASREQSPMHRYLSPGTYIVRLTVLDHRGATDSITHTVTVAYHELTPEPVAYGGALAPYADAGADQIVPERSQVQLHGQAPPGARYQWTQVAGPRVILDNSTSASPRFAAPRLNSTQPIELVFSFVATDGAIRSAADFVIVTVTSANRAPVPHLGETKTVVEGSLVGLDASQSRDPDGDGLAFSWRQIAGPAVVLQHGDTAKPWFMAPPFPAENPLKFTVSVSDSHETSEDTVLVFVTRIVLPDPAFAFAMSAHDPRNVTFRVLAADAAHSHWEFGDGTSANGTEVTHHFREPGTYQVRVTRTTDAGQTHSAQNLTFATPKSVPVEDSTTPWAFTSLAAGALLAIVGFIALALARRHTRKGREGSK